MRLKMGVLCCFNRGLQILALAFDYQMKAEQGQSPVLQVDHALTVLRKRFGMFRSP